MAEGNWSAQTAPGPSQKSELPLSGQRIVIYGMNYAPEIAGVGKYTGEIAGHFAAAGADVHVVTTPPHYPGWRVQEGYKNSFSKSREENVHVNRTPLLLRRKMKGIWRLLAPLSFAVSSAPVVFWKIITLRPQTVFCVEPTLFAAPVAQLASWIVGARTLLHVQDLEVDAAFAMGHLNRSKLLQRLGTAFERSVLKRFNHVITISGKMADKLVEKGCSGKRITLVRNWVDLDHIFPLAGENAYRTQLDLFTHDYVVLYSGNIGAKQGLDILLEAAKKLESNARIKFIIAGEGPVKLDLIEKYGNLNNVRFLPFQPHQKLNEFLNCADLHALMQEKGAADLVLPSKLGAMLATGKQIVVTADSGTELYEFLGDAAVFVQTGDVEALVNAITALQEGRLPHYPEKIKKLAFTLAKDAALSQLVRLQNQTLDAQGALP
ncbi:WcaI family glycosyltransferase [Rhizobium sp. FKL33]|uniref:WcaI family glycosyltransferase n=1 Tax=Rhizobium sp. FKL33 TaxID=2562307 RepID=UPI0010C04331|nr:WcaI family glycosyltransferase [Rhizobium sp. FKL33]